MKHVNMNTEILKMTHCYGTVFSHLDIKGYQLQTP